ncbi:hypothetical protein HDU93_008306 [Gonapodya sp. JEL0774]|nr:hypothetical protein HDU93_008306 [Gonapodya sp. JEL0774]
MLAPSHPGYATQPDVPDPVILHVVSPPARDASKGVVGKGSGKSGKLPEWVNGTYEIHLSPEASSSLGTPTFHFQHWFDGLSQVQRFYLSGTNNTIEYRSRNTADDARSYIARTGTHGTMFGQRAEWAQGEEERGWIGWAGEMLRKAVRFPGNVAMAWQTKNVNVAISPNYPIPHDPRPDLPPLPKDGSTSKPTASTTTVPTIHTLVAKTDANTLQSLDPLTLNPLRYFYLEDLDRSFGGTVTAAHHQVDPDTMDRWNLTLDFFDFGGAPGATEMFPVVAKILRWRGGDKDKWGGKGEVAARFAAPYASRELVE